ncbi:MAG: type II toxin-antitoxin system VapC family toxin [Armatimonadota bacterium]
MPSNRKVIYWDSGVWLSYINGESERLPVIDSILADSASDKGKCKLYTSVLTQVEVAFAKSEQDGKALDPDIEEKIDQLWDDTESLSLIEFHEGIGRTARELMRHCLTKGWSLKAMDALHLATAKFLGADEIHTYDEKWLKLESILGIPIMLPATEQPSLPT